MKQVMLLTMLAFYSTLALGQQQPDQCLPSDGFPWNLPAANSEIKEPEQYLVLGGQNEVSAMVCNCSKPTATDETMTVWVVSWKKVGSKAEKLKLIEQISQHPAEVITLQPSADKKPPDTNTMTVSPLSRGACIAALGTNISVIHNDTKAKRTGRFKIQK